MQDRITLRVARYRPEQESKPTFDEYEVPLREDWAVLDGLNHVKDQLDGTLSYRWSCRMGICGSCGVTVNGEPVLSCAAFLTDFAPGPVTIEPLRNFPVIRDLVIEMTDFMHKLGRVRPWIVTGDEPPPVGEHGEHLQTPAELEEYHQYSMCINCLLCYSACPVYGLDQQFVGPAALALAQRYNLDSRDQGDALRMAELSSHDGVWGCTFVGECTKACPKGVDPAGAIQRYKVTAATEAAKSLLLPRAAGR
jgi:fumarate reductase iron-sulfur subunit